MHLVNRRPRSVVPLAALIALLVATVVGLLADGRAATGTGATHGSELARTGSDVRGVLLAGLVFLVATVGLLLEAGRRTAEG